MSFSATEALTVSRTHAETRNPHLVLRGEPSTTSTRHLEAQYVNKTIPYSFTLPSLNPLSSTPKELQHAASKTPIEYLPLPRSGNSTPLHQTLSHKYQTSTNASLNHQIPKTLNVCAFSEYMSKQLEKLPVLQDVEIMSERIICVRGRNSGTFTLQGTNTYIVGSGRERLIIDTGDGNEGWILSVKNVLRKHHISITMVLLTHWHGDHTGGVPDLLKINPTLEGSIWKMDPDKGQQPILNGQIFHVEGATVQAIYTPGHSHDHMCFRLEDENALFTGDTILGHGSTAIEDLGAYTESLKKMQDLRCTDGYPGHGAHIDNLPGKISAELNQKLRREKSVLDALRKVHSTSGDISGIGRGLNVQELVVTMYGNIDEQLREKVLKPSVEQVLEKLMAEERVGWRIRGQEKGWFVVEV